MGNGIGDEGACALASLSGLTSLKLFANHRIGPEGARALVALTGLTSLDLGGNRIGDDGARALAALTTLTSLKLFENGISEVDWLLELDRLEAVDLSRNHIRSVCPQLWLKPRLRYACLAEGSLGDVPSNVLSKQYVEDCLPRLRAYLCNSATKQAEPVPT
jgi:Leucine-rich repeat (LRR) protein